MSTFKIAVIPGDGIGQEVTPEGLRVLDFPKQDEFRVDLRFTA